MIQRFIHLLAETPVVFDFLKSLPEGGYYGHRALIRSEVQPLCGRVLDLGCGTGIFAPNFSTGQYVGVDVNPKYIDHARLKYPGYEFKCIDGSALPFEPATFDVAFVAGVFHHLDDATSERVLAEAHRVLKPGGALIVWEDVPARFILNVVGHLIHHLDEGRYIRKAEGYRALFARRFSIAKEFAMRSAFMDYQVFKLLR